MARPDQDGPDEKLTADYQMEDAPGQGVMPQTRFDPFPFCPENEEPIRCQKRSLA